MPVAIILPCYNPPPNCAEHIIAQHKALTERIGDTIELIVVKDGTANNMSDADVQLLNNSIPNFKCIAYEENRGKGYAIRQGVAATDARLVIYTDIDFPYTLDSVLDIYTALKGGSCDVAVGVKNENYYKHVPKVRRYISRQLQILIRLFLSMPITDTQCGLKGFHNKVKPLFLQTTIDRYLFDLEFIRNCFRSKEKFRVKAIPIQLNEQIHFRNMNYRILLPETFNFIRLLFK